MSGKLTDIRATTPVSTLDGDELLEVTDDPSGAPITGATTINEVATFVGSAHSHAAYSPTSHNHSGTYATSSHTHNYAATSHTHNYAATSHNHDGAYEPAGHDHDTDYASFTHSHATYADIGHTHPSGPHSHAEYSSTAHDHDSDYEPLGHDHDSDYATASHNHSGTYATSGHSHSGTYATSGHNHSGTYATAAHTHADKADTVHSHSAYSTTGHTHSDPSNYSSLGPVGEIIMYGDDSAAPTGFLFCDGAAVSRTTYSDLFDVIGTNYGSGNGSTTFNLPNFGGRHPVGENQIALPSNGYSLAAYVGDDVGNENHRHSLTGGEDAAAALALDSNRTYARHINVSPETWNTTNQTVTPSAAGAARWEGGSGTRSTGIELVGYTDYNPAGNTQYAPSVAVTFCIRYLGT